MLGPKLLLAPLDLESDLVWLDPSVLEEVSCNAVLASLASHSWASAAGASVVTAEVSVLLSVDWLPLAAIGAESQFLLNLPPARVDSAVRESAAMEPAPSWMGILDHGSVVFCIAVSMSPVIVY